MDLGIISHKELLILMTPIELGEAQGGTEHPLQQSKQLQEGTAVGEASSYIERFSLDTVDLSGGFKIAGYGIIDVQEITNLLAVSCYREGLGRWRVFLNQGLLAKPSNPTLIEC
jgi:hypothetical protein